MTNQKKSLKPTKTFGTKVKQFLKTNYKALLFSFSLFAINCALIAITCVGKGVVFTSKRFIITAIFILVVSVVLCFFAFYARKKKWPIEKIFLVVGTTLGLMYAFAIPMGRAPDEPAHIWRTYAIAQGNVLTDVQDEENGNYLPENIANFGATYVDNAYVELAHRVSEPISENYVFHKTITSNPIDHLPHTISMLLGRLLHLPILVILYLARLCGLAICIVIIYYCIKFIPILKKPLLFISCLPLSMQTFISISYDGMIFCSIIALITFILYTIYQPKYIFKPLHGLLLALLCLIAIAVKPVYFPICCLLAFVPTRCFKNKKRKALAITAILFLTAGLFFLWSFISILSQPGNGADTNGQISFILSNPARFIAILIHNILNSPYIYLQRLGALEWLDAHTSDFYIISSLIVFATLCVEEYYTSKKHPFPKYFRFGVLVATALTIVLIFTGLYIQWTPVGAYVIEGVQTRYFLPILIGIPLAITILRKKHSTQPEKNAIDNIYLYNFLILLNLNAITILLCTHI